MQSEELIRYFERVVAGRPSRLQAERAIAAVLATLAECLPASAAHNLAEQLPQPFKAQLTPTSEQLTLSLSEFLGRTAEREGISPSEAQDHTRAVLETLAQAVTGQELHELCAQLPGELAPLFKAPAAAGWPETHRRRPHP